MQTQQRGMPPLSSEPTTPACKPGADVVRTSLRHRPLYIERDIIYRYLHVYIGIYESYMYNMYISIYKDVMYIIYIYIYITHNSHALSLALDRESSPPNTPPGAPKLRLFKQ